MKKANILALSAAIAGVLVSSASYADATANIGAATNYLWRGTSLSNERAQVFGGVDYSHSSGLYAGVWASSEGYVGAQATGDPTGETDWYAGFSGESGKFSYDLGYLMYKYAQSGNFDFEEGYLSLGYSFASLYYASSADLKSDYYALTLEYEWFSFVYGDFSFDRNKTGDYSHYDLSAALTDELSITYATNDLDSDDNGRLVVSYGLEFEL